MGRRRAVLVVEYDDRREPHLPRSAEFWEQVIQKGQATHRPNVINVRVQVQDEVRADA